MTHDNQGYQGATINVGNGASFGSGAAGDTNNSYNHTTNDTYEGDTYTGPVHGGNVGGRQNNNTINNDNSRSQGGDSTEAMQRKLERLRALLAARKAGEERLNLARNTAAAEAELTGFDDPPQYSPS